MFVHRCWRQSLQRLLISLFLILPALVRAQSNVGFVLLHSFAPLNGGGINSEGANPSASLFQGADGLFYGACANGGANGNGTLFIIDKLGDFTTLYSFTAEDSHGFNSDGAQPNGLI